MISQTAWTAGLAPADFDEAYTTYCACIRTFARALGALGTSPAQRGQDDNGVMEDSINACEDTVHVRCSLRNPSLPALFFQVVDAIGGAGSRQLPVYAQHCYASGMAADAARDGCTDGRNGGVGP